MTTLIIVQLILAIFDSKPLKFEFHHLSSSNSTYIDKDFDQDWDFILFDQDENSIYEEQIQPINIQQSFKDMFEKEDVYLSRV